MPSHNYNSAPITNRERAVRDLSAAERFRRADTRYAFGESLAKRQYGPTPKHLALSDKEKFKQRKQVRRQLSRLQKNAPKLSAGLAAGKKSALKILAGGLMRQVDWTADWLFILLGSFALLKDITDIVFAAAGTVGSGIWSALVVWIPLAGPALAGAGIVTMSAIGMTFTFTGNTMFLILTVTVLVLVGSSLKNRGMAKYFFGVAIEFIAEALPGISWLPWTVVYVFILYLCVLCDKMMNESERKKAEA